MLQVISMHLKKMHKFHAGTVVGIKAPVDDRILSLSPERVTIRAVIFLF